MNTERLQEWTQTYLDYKLQVYAKRNLDCDTAFNALPSDRFSRWMTKSSETYYKEENSKILRLNARLNETGPAACCLLGEQTVALLRDLFPEDTDHRFALDTFLDSSREMGELAPLAPQLNKLYNRTGRELISRLNRVKNDQTDVFSNGTFFNHTIVDIRIDLTRYCEELIACGKALEETGRPDLAQTIQIEPNGFNSLAHAHSDLQNGAAASPLTVSTVKKWLGALGIQTFYLADMANAAAQEMKEAKEVLINQINLEPLPDQTCADLADTIQTLPSKYFKPPVRGKGHACGSTHIWRM